MSIFNKEATLIALNEKKTSEEYARRSFKKEYNFKPGKSGSDSGTITDEQGKKYHVDTKPDEGVDTGADTWSKDSHIDLDKKFFRLKGSNHGERRKAILQHELGHQNLHNWNPDNRTVDRKNRSMESIKDDAITTIKNSIGKDYSSKSDERIFKVADVDAEGYRKTIGTKEERDRRNSDLEKAKKYAKDGHTNAQEFEADRFAANKTSESSLKKGLRNYNKYVRKEYQEFSKKEALKDETPKERSRRIGRFNSSVESDYTQRSRAVKDKDLRNAKTYK